MLSQGTNHLLWLDKTFTTHAENNSLMKWHGWATPSQLDGGVPFQMFWNVWKMRGMWRSSWRKADVYLRQTVSYCDESSPKVGRNWKWSNEVKMSEMSIFWCISMLNNVKSYKKINEKAQMANFSIFARGFRLLQELFAKNMVYWGN